MAPLRGSVYNDRGASPASRLASNYVVAKLNTWDAGVRVTLDKDNAFEVFVSTDDPEDPRDLLIRGNASTGEITYMKPGLAKEVSV